MAGIGIQLNRIFGRRMVMTSLYGAIFSVNYAIGPMLVVMGCLLLMYKVLGFNDLGYVDRELFSCSVLYIFVFSLIANAPFNATLSKYMTDRIYLERFDDIRPCAQIGIALNLAVASLVSIPFYLRVILVGNVPVYYVFTSYVGYLSLSLVMAAMVYNSILKHYRKIAKYFLCGMIATFLLSVLFRFLCGMSVTYAMLLAMTIGFLIIAILEYANVLRNFRENSRNYMDPLRYFKRYWKLALANFLYIFGLFAHNFAFWSVSWHLVVLKSYVCNQPYDMATFVAMLTSISGTVLFIAFTEMRFHERYQEYTNAVIGGKLDAIEKAKKRMFRALSQQMLSLVEIQFIFSVVIYLLANILMPVLGFSGMTMDIYPLLAVGYFISYVMYSGILFLYYFNDLNGSVVSCALFAAISLGASIFATRLPIKWYGCGFALAAFAAFTYIYFRLRWVERNLSYHIFCAGGILKPGDGKMPPAEVYRRAGT
jgi:uncharacterized membrane protein